MSIVFFGTPDFAVPSLKALIASGEAISVVVTQSDKAKGRGHTLSAPAVKLAAAEAGLPVAQPATLRDAGFLARLAALSPEFVVVAAYGKILPKAVLELPLRGCVNVHASLLPRYRGAAPIAWSIIRGEEKTGITTMLMDKGLDTGAIILQRETEISGEDTAATLGARLAELGASLLTETLKGMRTGSLTPRPQSGEPSYAPPLKKEDGLIDWTRPTEELARLVRGMQPWPGAYTYLGKERITVLAARPSEGDAPPGLLRRIEKKGLLIGTGRGLLFIARLQPAGKKPMSATAFIQGRRLKEGMTLG
ncbi:MAG: methionyl-tRNA formyltransferase [Nitrospirae bacterium]|nr:methionyl-tRNA formyltransferase [Nitrospirota bacterium]